MLNLAHHYQRLYSLLIPERLIEAMQADSWIALGQLENAGHWVRSYRPDETLFMGLTEGVENVTLARFYLSQGQPETALGFLDRLRSSAHLSDHQGDLIEVLGLAALAQHAVGEAQQAIETLQTALQLAEPEGYVRTFVDMGQPMAALLYQALAAGVFPEYVARLLALFPVEEVTPLISSSIQNVTSTNVALIEPLSQREIEVLQLMASGASNEEIARKLVIATTTAKKHVSNILRKLGADNRTQAVARGRSLGLCE
jgi:LuxR family maltose regulon positive regulatory protein